MSTPSRFSAFAVTFAAVYAVLYYFALVNNWALFSYGPALNEWMAFNHPASGGPTMYWYGWIATSVIGGAGAGVVVAMLPEKFRSRIWPGFAWLVPLATIVAIMHLLSGYFTR
jgi:hypothetical protein